MNLNMMNGAGIFFLGVGFYAAVTANIASVIPIFLGGVFIICAYKIEKEESQSNANQASKHG